MFKRVSSLFVPRPSSEVVIHSIVQTSYLGIQSLKKPFFYESSLRDKVVSCVQRFASTIFVQAMAVIEGFSDCQKDDHLIALNWSARFKIKEEVSSLNKRHQLVGKHVILYEEIRSIFDDSLYGEFVSYIEGGLSRTDTCSSRSENFRKSHSKQRYAVQPEKYLRAVISKAEMSESFVHRQVPLEDGTSVLLLEEVSNEEWNQFPESIRRLLVETDSRKGFYSNRIAFKENSVGLGVFGESFCVFKMAPISPFMEDSLRSKLMAWNVKSYLRTGQTIGIKHIIEDSDRLTMEYNIMSQYKQVNILSSYRLVDADMGDNVARFHFVPLAIHGDGVQFIETIRTSRLCLQDKKSMFIGILKQLLNAMSFLNEQSIYHRDIKPENFLFHYNGCLKLSDFGRVTTLQRGNEVCGTAGYAAPEFYSGTMSSFNYEKSDMYSVGVIAGFMHNMTAKTSWWNGYYVEPYGQSVFELPKDVSMKVEPSNLFDVAVLTKTPARECYRRPSSVELLEKVLFSSYSMDKYFNLAQQLPV